MPTVVHLLPYDGIGGAEAAARSMLDAPSAGLDFRLEFIFPDVRSRQQRLGTFNPLAFLSTAWRLARKPPDLLILSLWRSCVVGLVAKLLRPRLRLVVLVHNSVDAHAADYVFTRLAMAAARAVWADSEASMRLRFRRPPTRKTRVIPFLTRHLRPLQPMDAHVLPAPRFVFWGRLAAQKNLGRALALFRRIHGAHPDARFVVIGPDSGELAMLRRQCAEADLGDAVEFTGPLDFPDIEDRAKDCHFYLQTSRYEGMALSVVEAMQLGLVPVVTPVGEIASYCRDDENAVLVDDDTRAAAAVAKLLADASSYRRLRRNAMLAWRDQALYRDVVAAECRRLVGDPGNRDTMPPPED